jgi:hypothetical protein
MSNCWTISNNKVCKKEFDWQTHLLACILISICYCAALFCNISEKIIVGNRRDWLKIKEVRKHGDNY